MCFSKNHQENLRNKIYYSQVPEGHTAREGGWTWDLLERGRGRVSQVLSLLTNLKHKRGNQGVGREKLDHSSGQLSRLPQTLKKRTLRSEG